MYIIPLKINIDTNNKKYIPYIIELLKDLKMINEKGVEYLEGQYECIKFLEELRIK